ncbi:MAG: WD40 repeat domain-containing protein, partial [Myxococcota bacterium]|nr:WD40 repeat domain-containing protein [Myxococcota bacterium]
KKKRLLPIKKPQGEPVKLKGHRKKISDITFSPNGRWLATCSFDRTIRIWDGKKGIQKAVLFGGHRNRIRRLTYRIDGEQLASVGDDGGARLWDMKTGRRMFRLLGHETPATHVCYSPNGRFLVTAAEDATVFIWSVETAERILKLGPYDGGISDICFDKEGMWIAIAHKNRVDLWDLNRNERKASFLAKGDALRILSTQKGNLIIGDDRGLRMIDPGSGAHHLQFRGHYKGITALALDPGGSSLVSAGIDQTVRVWELQDAQLHWTFDMRKTVRRLSVNKAGSIAMGFDESFAILFEMGRGV